MIRAMQRAFTLVEILIVVVILGILSAIVVPLFSSATKDAEAGAAIESLSRTRRILAAYYVRNGNSSPTIVNNGTGLTAWGEMGTAGYLKEAPVNPWVGKTASEIVVHGPGPDTAYHQNYGWIFDPASGDLWAAAFDAQDQPLPRP